MVLLRDTLLKYTFLLLLLALVSASYYRFFVLRDYYVSYEIPCDPYAADCFVWCEDDACEEESYYLVIERPAYEIRALCGSDITDCEASLQCAEGEEDCIVIECIPDSEECDAYSAEDLPQEAIDLEPLMDETVV